MSIPKIFAAYRLLIAAIAATEPEQAALWCVSRGIENDQATEPLPGYVFESWVGGDILGLHKKFTFLLPSPGLFQQRLGISLVGIHYSTGVLDWSIT